MSFDFDCNTMLVFCTLNKLDIYIYVYMHTLVFNQMSSCKQLYSNLIVYLIGNDLYSREFECP